MNFDLLRLVLVSRHQTSLFEKRPAKDSGYDREAWIREVLSREFRFVYRKKTFHYLPQSDEGRFITAKIGRSRLTVENEPPEQGFDKVERDKWVVSALIIDPVHGADGQKVAFEHNEDLGQSVGLMRALFSDTNLDLESPFIIEPNAILDPKSFWDFEKSNRGNIVSASLELVAPNMFGLREAIDEEMSELRDNEKAVSATITLKNPAGLELNTERVVQTVAYASEGGGSIKARTRRRRTFKSEDRVKKTELPHLKEIEFESFSSMIGEAIRGIFGDD